MVCSDQNHGRTGGLDGEVRWPPGRGPLPALARKRTSANSPDITTSNGADSPVGVLEQSPETHPLATGASPTTVTARASLAYARDPAVEAQIDQFAVLYPFPLDEFQREAIRTLIHGDSVMVAAPTGTGKTVIAEYGIYEALRRTGRVLYTTPIKALSNQKFRDLRALYGDEVGLLTGDVSENRDARIVVMTTEVLRNMLLQTPWDLDEVDCVIFDEIHYLADQERGTTWEESIILCPEHVQLICLSATVSNADEIASWISRTHRPIRLITHTERAVPLSLYYFVDGKLHQVVDHNGKLIRDFPHTGGEARRQNGRGGGGSRRLSEYDDPGMDEPQPREIIDALASRDMLPAIYFLFSRNDCQTFAERLAVMRPHLVKPLQLKMIEATIDTYMNALRPEDRELEQVRLITDLARKGIGFHHAGLLPVLKQLVEVLFGRGLMEVVFATDTLALGVNMPARSVVIGRMSKWDGRRRRVLIPNEFQQMAGRAGRRGMDAFGHVIVPYSPWIAFRDMLEIATGPLEPVRSAFAVRYNTVLNLWDPPHGERVRSMLQQSLAQFQTSQRIRQLEDDIIEIGGDIAGVPKGCLIGLDAGDELLEDYRNINGTLTTAQQKERRIKAELAEVQRAAISPPWPEPGRQALRRAFRYAPIGLVAHHREFGWGVYVGKGRGGVGLFLFGRLIKSVNEYRQIDYLTDGKTVKVPEALIEPSDPVEDATALVPEEELARVWTRVDRLDLPDLDAMAEEHRSREQNRVSGELVSLKADAADARAQVNELHRVRQEHPCHLCPRRKEHRDYLQRIDRLEKERRALEEVLHREAEAEEARIRGVIRGIREILNRFGYLYRGYPTPKADMLADVFDNDGLILCEMVDRGLLDRLAPEDLAEVFSWFSFDRDFRYQNHFTLPDQLVLLRRRLEDLEHVILGEERDNGLYISEGHNATFYGAARAWCLGSTMVEIGEVIELSEGDLVLTFNKTIDLMRQVREMLADVTPHRPLRLTLQEAERLLRRGIVEQSLKLGFAPIEAPATPEAASDEAPAGADHSVLVETPSKPKRRRTAKAATAQAEPEESASPAKRRKTRVTAMEAEPLEAVASIPAEVANESTPATTRRRRITKKPAAEA
ncbi:MAG: ATP-dependent helicase HelY [Thermomicrobiales bacterium]|nr:ATP-dependent helicase HelY [Thermomicrobiales bacterium]